MGQTNFLDHCPLDPLHGQIPLSKSYAAIDIVVPKGQFGISDTDQYEWEFPTHTRQLYRTSSDDISPPSQLQQTYVIPSYLPVDKIIVPPSALTRELMMRSIMNSCSPSTSTSTFGHIST